MDDLEGLLKSWLRRLEAERKSPDTRRTYGDGVRAYLAWRAARDGHAGPALSAADVTEWTRDLLGQRSPATALSRQAAVRRFSKWLAAEGETERDDLAGLKPPRLDEKAVQALTAGQLRALLATCRGKAFHDVRDRAAIQLLAETGARAAELTAMTTDDVDLDHRLAVIRRGKGGKGRVVGFSPVAADYLDTYLRARRRHRLAAAGALWLGSSGRQFGYWGLYTTIRRRGQSIGLDIHPHSLRHTSAVRWLRKGGSEAGLMAQAGWQSVDMLRRYIRAAEGELAAEEADRLNLGDI